MLDHARANAAADTVRVIRSFVASYDRNDADDRAIAVRIRQVLHSELYRREREIYAEWVDLGGEA